MWLRLIYSATHTCNVCPLTFKWRELKTHNLMKTGFVCELSGQDEVDGEEGRVNK